jgi:hypothetical protein
LVLVAGGDPSVGGNGIASAELYNPASGKWSATSSLASGRWGHSATPLTNGKVLVAAGWGSFNILTSAELYDPVSGTWSVTGSLANGRYDHTAALLLNGQVLVAGGYDGQLNNPTLASAELYGSPGPSLSVTSPSNYAIVTSRSLKFEVQHMLVAKEALIGCLVSMSFPRSVV